MRALVRAVLAAYGGRTGVHRLLVDHLLAPADASVLAHGVGGVVRALLHAPEQLDGAQRQAIEDALVRLVLTVMARGEVVGGKP